MVPLPRAADVMSGLSRRHTPEQVGALIDRTVLLVRHYTRGQGFSPQGSDIEPELARLVVDTVRRAVLNPEQPLACAGPLLDGTPGSFADWTLAEQGLLEVYRTRSRV